MSRVPPDADADGGLHVLVVDDEHPVRDELAYLLGADPRIARVDTAGSGAEALRTIERHEVDAVFLDIAMPGPDGIEIATVLAGLPAPPRVVFVTAHEEHAVDAFDLHAVDYLLKPVRPDRLSEAVRRVVAARDDPAPVPGLEPGDEVIPVERAGITRFVARSEVAWVEAHGDYARLHTASGAHLVRVALSMLEHRWAAAGFVRIHRSLLVDIHRVIEVRSDAGRVSVIVPGEGPDGQVELRVARRHARDLRDRLVRGSRP